MQHVIDFFMRQEIFIDKGLYRSHCRHVQTFNDNVHLKKRLSAMPGKNAGKPGGHALLVLLRNFPRAAAKIFFKGGANGKVPF